MLFNGIYQLVKGWIDEKTRKKVQVCGSNYLPTLLKYCDPDVIPTFLGGKCAATFQDDFGPWTEYEIVDSTDPAAQVGIRYKNDPNKYLHTYEDSASLPNPCIQGLGKMGTKGAVLYKDDGTIQPNFEANRSIPTDDDVYAEV